MHPLRRLRLIISTIMTLVVAALFLDLGHLIPASWTAAFTMTQFGPAFLKALSGARPGIIGVVAVVILTLLFGRVYCSHLCPLGVFQDIVIWIRKRRFKHRRFPYTRPNFSWHYAVTAVVITLAVAGGMLVLNILEPFSNAGRILTQLVRPVLVLGNNGLAGLLPAGSWMAVNRIPLAFPDLSTLAGVFCVAGGIFILSFRSGRLFCNLLCPVGGVLSLLSHRPAYAITIRKHECIDCGLCERVCRAQCIDSERRTVDTAACVGCFDCLTACPTHGMEFSWKRGGRSAQTTAQTGRRRILTGVSALAGRWMLPDLSETDRQLRYDRAKSDPVVPPGGGSRERFGGLCTACHLCVSACPTQVIQPALAEYGWTGVFQPRMEYAVNYCTFDCVACGEVCPTGALLPLTVDAKHVLQIGKTVFVKEDCIVETKKKDCGACAEHCPTKAVRMVPYEGKLTIPEVNNEYCVGCGACEHACPTEPRRAIYVEPNRIHQAAKPRVAERDVPLQATPEEFPF